MKFDCRWIVVLALVALVSCGGDMRAAMQAAGVGEEEIQEMMCLFVSLHGAVVRS